MFNWRAFLLKPATSKPTVGSSVLAPFVTGMAAPFIAATFAAPNHAPPAFLLLPDMTSQAGFVLTITPLLILALMWSLYSGVHLIPSLIIEPRSHRPKAPRFVIVETYHILNGNKAY